MVSGVESKVFIEEICRKQRKLREKLLVEFRGLLATSVRIDSNYERSNISAGHMNA